MRHEAIYLTHSNVVSISDDDGAFDSNGNLVTVNEDIVQAKIQELQATEPMRQLREQRNNLLAQTDWRMTTDYPYSDQAQWATYRTELRDLPSTAEPTLDEQGNLTNVVWPIPPDDL